MNSGKIPQNKKNMIWLILFAVLTLVLWNIPNGKLFLYPFTILGTWFHEMGHGLTAWILGGNFNRLEIYPNGSGLAQFSHNFNNLKLGITAGAGPFGPTIAGFILIYASLRKSTAKYGLILLSVIMIASCIIWIRPVFGAGFFIILFLGIIFAYLAIKSNTSTQSIILQFLGIQAFMSVYLSVDYLFSKGGIVGNAQYYSDTQVMADNLLLPFWFWAGLIIIFSLIVIFYSMKLAFGKR